MRRSGILVILALYTGLLTQTEANSEFESDLATVAALGDLTNAPIMWTDDTDMAATGTVSAGEMKAIYFDALDYTGAPTRVYAYVGIPAGASAGSPVPGAVLVHGGGGTAYADWVTEWTNRGYAAISIAVEGQTDERVDGKWVKHAMAGPSRGALYNDSPDSLTDQWMYHAVADCVLANSLLRSLPEVDANKVGLSGFSWGGVITSTAIGIDNRFTFAIPTYGCGHLYDARNYYGHNLANNESYKQIWDPMIRITNAAMPVLWFSWPEEPHFPMDSLAYTYHGAPGRRMVSLKPGMGHGGNWHSPESYDFADSIISSGAPWCEQQSISLVGSTATVVFNSTKDLNSASLIYATENDEITTDISTNMDWTETPLSAPVEAPAGTWTVTATVPGNATAWFINAKATGSDTNDLYGYTTADLTVSSDYQENIDLILSPADALTIEHLLADDQTSGTVDLSYTGPANVEISSIAISDQSHPGAFTNLTAAPLVLNNPTPVTTPLTIQFDNTVAGLTDEQTATGMVTIVWDHLDGSTDQAQIPVSAKLGAAPTSVDIDDVLASRIFDDDQDGSGDAVHQNQQWVGELSEADYATVFVFQMTDDAEPGAIASADFSVTQDASFGDALPNIRVDAYTRSTSPINASDYELATGVGGIQTNFASATSPATISLAAGGKANLKEFLNANWSPGDYLFIRLKFEGAVTEDGRRFGDSSGGWTTGSTDAQLTIAWDPDITELDIDYAELQRIQDTDADDAGNWAGGSPANNLVGYFEQDSVGNMQMAWSFQMQGVFDGSRIAYADFIVNQTGTGGGAYAYDIEAHVIRTASGSGIVASDYEDSAGVLMERFNNAATGTASLNGPGKVALASYLQDHWSKGDYVVIGLKTDPPTLTSYPGGSNDFYRYATGGTLRIGLHPPPGTRFIIR
ncbi:MAG: hypothetical protein HN341_16150 [Verrucomicrobia bacterium]|jgi:dienelactone hydrolase|nr:hypothetical protein [Verrucomicrobiota bacterium]